MLRRFVRKRFVRPDCPPVGVREKKRKKNIK